MKVKQSFEYYEGRVTSKYYLMWSSDPDNFVAENRSLLKRLQVYGQRCDEE